MGDLGSKALAGEFLLRYGLVEEGAHLLERALGAGEGDGQVHERLAEARLVLDDLPSAVEHFENAKRVMGTGALVDSSLGIVLTLQGRHDAAIEAHGRALAALPSDEISPATVLLVWNAAHSLLASGRLVEGWDAYEARIPLGFGPVTGVALPEWPTAGADAHGVLVLDEQGIGDAVLFGTCLPDLLEEPQRVFIECDHRLVPLLARSFPTATVGPRGMWSDPGTHPSDGGPEACIALGSLPRRYRRALSDFRGDGAYLRSDPGRVEAWQKRLGELPPGARVGLSWRSLGAGGRRRREYAPLQAWAPILRQPGVQFVNLQYGDCEPELQEVERQFGITIARWDDVNLFDDLDGLAALIDALDVVVAPRNSVAHLSGAVGTRTLMLANPHVWSDLGTGSLPWFRAVSVFYRRPGDDWAEAMELAGEELGRLT